MLSRIPLKSILSEVRIILGHNDLSTAVNEIGNNVDSLTFDEIIRREIRAAARQLLLIAPKEKMEWRKYGIVTSGSEKNTQFVSNYDEYGNYKMWVVDLPEDFIRLGSAKLLSWPYPLSEATSNEELAYKKQFSEYEGLKATPDKPVMAIVSGVGNKNLQLQMFGTLGNVSGEGVSHVTICTEPCIYDAQRDGNVKEEAWDGTASWYLEYPASLYQPFLYMCASLVAKSLEDYAMSADLLNTAKGLMIDNEATRRDIRIYGTDLQDQLTIR